MSYKILDNRDIDLSYNSESENAQSGKAVAEAVASFVTKKYVDNNIEEVNDKINNLKGVATGSTIEINDISPTSHYVKCNIENKIWGADFVTEEVNFADFKTRISLKTLPRNYYYKIDIAFDNGIRQEDILMAIDSSTWQNDILPRMQSSNFTLTYAYLPEDAALFIDKVSPEEVLSISMVISNSAEEFSPIELNQVAISVNNKEDETKTYYANENGIVTNIVSEYPSMSITTDIPVDITCEYVKDNQLAEVVNMIVERYINEQV